MSATSTRDETLTERVLHEIGAARARRESPRGDHLHVRLSREEAEAIRRRAQAEGISISAFVRERVI